MSVFNADYPVEALDIPLDKSCLPERYYLLTECKDALIAGLKRLGCRKKSDAMQLADDALLCIGLKATETVNLLRRFLTLYDPKPQKLREIEKISASPEEIAAYRELYCLPGVSLTRATLYYRSGYRSIESVANSTVEELLEKTARTILDEGLPWAVPLPKEVRTHIAVARAFTMK